MFQKEITLKLTSVRDLVYFIKVMKLWVFLLINKLNKMKQLLISTNLFYIFSF